LSTPVAAPVLSFLLFVVRTQPRRKPNLPRTSPFYLLTFVLDTGSAQKKIIEERLARTADLIEN
jgi:hypothetical protein